MTRHLTDKEKVTLDLMAIGLTDREIATVTGYSLAAIKSQVRNILVKLRAVNRCHAVYVAFRRNLLSRTRTIAVPEQITTATDKRNSRRGAAA